jgi:hypothetical protein
MNAKTQSFSNINQGGDWASIYAFSSKRRRRIFHLIPATPRGESIGAKPNLRKKHTLSVSPISVPRR